MRNSTIPFVSALLVTIAGCGNGGPLEPAEQIGTNEAAASDGRSYVTGYFGLQLDGLDCGLVQKVEGGDAEGDVVSVPTSSSYLVKKHIGNVKYNDISVQLPIKASACTEWISDTLAGKPTRKSGRIVSYDATFGQRAVREFADALITEIAFPALDAASKDVAYLTLKFSPWVVRNKKGDGSKVAPPGKELPARASDFSVVLDGLDTKRVSKVDALTIKQTVVKDTVGDGRDYLKEPGKLEIPNLKITMSEVDSDGFFAWHEDFVIKGNNGDDKEKTGSIVFLDPTRKQALLTIDLRNLGIFRAAKTNNADKVATVTAEMYCENLQAKFSRVAPPVDADAGR